LDDIREMEEMDEIEKPEKREKKKNKLSIVALKHERVLAHMEENVRKGKKANLYRALRAEGYSDSYSRKGGVGFTKTWEQLLVDRLGDDKLTNVMSELVVAKKLDYMLFNSEVSDEDIYILLESVGCIPKKIIHGMQGTHVYYFAPDHRTRKDAIELAGKWRGKMLPETIKVEQTGLRAMSDADLAHLVIQARKKFLKKD